MIRKNELLLYNSTKYKELKLYYSEQEKEIKTITEIIQNEEIVQELIGYENVIDVSAFTHINQYSSERLMNLLDDTFSAELFNSNL